MTTAAAGDLRALTQSIYKQYSFQRLRPCETTVSSGLKGAESCKDERFFQFEILLDGGRHVHKSPPCAQEKSVQMAIKESQRSTERKHLSQHGTLLLYRIHTIDAPEDLWDQFWYCFLVSF